MLICPNSQGSTSQLVLTFQNKNSHFVRVHIPSIQVSLKLLRQDVVSSPEHIQRVLRYDRGRGESRVQQVERASRDLLHAN